MATNIKQALAKNIAETKTEIDTKTVSLRSLTECLIREVGDSGETFTTPLGAVQVTQRTSDRLADDMVVKFNVDKWHALDRRTRARLESLGLVSVDRRSIAGQAPKVVVRLV